MRMLIRSLNSLRFQLHRSTYLKSYFQQPRLLEPFLKALCTDIKTDYVPLQMSNEKIVNQTKQILLRGKSATDYQEKLIEDFIMNHETANFEEWNELLSNIFNVQYGLLSEMNIDAKVIDGCKILKKLNLARNYLAFMKQRKRKFNGAVVCNFIKVCYECRSELTEVDQKRIQIFVEFLLNRHLVLDSIMGDGVIKGLILLNQPDRALEILRKVEETGTANISSYSVLASYFLEINNFDRAVEFILNVLNNNLSLKDDVYLKWIEMSANDREKLDRLMNIFSRFEYFPKKFICDRLIMAYRNLPDLWKLVGIYGVISNDGQCQVCKQQLRNTNLSEKEFGHLREVFLKNVLVGSDIFKNTTPEELQRFFKMVEEKAPFDIVIDGLNVAYMIGINAGQNTFCKLISCVLKHFYERDKKVLFMGRKHMTKWPRFKEIMVEYNTTAFLIADDSQDDPFILYATLYSGINACFVTRDLMRNQKYSLNSDKDSALFKRWQHSHQIFITFIAPSGRVYYRTPIQFQQNVQQSPSGGWHIPYKEDADTNTDDYGIHRKWLCFQPYLHTNVV